jgi:hypothetical protein
MLNMEHTIEINNQQLPIIIKKHRTSRRMILRYQPKKNCISLTLPRYTSIKAGLIFVHEKAVWLTNQIANNLTKNVFADGSVFSILGEQITIKYVGGRGVDELEQENNFFSNYNSPNDRHPALDAGSREKTTCGNCNPRPRVKHGVTNTVDMEDNYTRTLKIHGAEEFLERRVRVFLHKKCKIEIENYARKFCTALNIKHGKITLRDTSSRWGSCSANGNLSFSWRLIFAPRAVLEYVVAHEVAHIVQHNHSPAFWAVVAHICPQWQQQRDWLKKHGKTLHKF